MKTVFPGQISTPELHGILQSSIAPRPIAFASTVDKDGNPNLAPYSFFNVFGSNPPTLVFAVVRRVRDNSSKHTLENIEETREVVINVVSYSMVQQTSLASTEYPKGVNEFIKAGFTPLPAEMVKPFRVKESPVQYECKVKDIIYTGSVGGSGSLIICEPILIHIHEDILNEQGKIDQQKIDLVGRLGDDWYVRASGKALFEVEKPLTSLGIGVDALPENIRFSHILTGNDLGILGNQKTLPNKDDALNYIHSKEFKDKLIALSPEIQNNTSHHIAQLLINRGWATDALNYLIANEP